MFLCSELWRSVKAQVINSFHSKVIHNIKKKKISLGEKYLI